MYIVYVQSIIVWNFQGIWSKCPKWDTDTIIRWVVRIDTWRNPKSWWNPNDKTGKKIAAKPKWRDWKEAQSLEVIGDMVSRRVRNNSWTWEVTGRRYDYHMGCWIILRSLESCIDFRIITKILESYRGRQSFLHQSRDRRSFLHQWRNRSETSQLVWSPKRELMKRKEKEFSLKKD